ncbi:site-2 protease family protein [Aliifodinibius sp. S!AR15-10]|uniref:site-2 protease family protein n=1 Tax=Aliifodinibius sp. S!AR15-10 TaxID=2950437 RepID=UPI0028558A70|nr:site-2 protease family protein [Aliifodinibius sp. S!AR15-10]MDR8394009.1 site-2 protease family protein [Aliifodinibius sp. S!AR15-10]
MKKVKGSLVLGRVKGIRIQVHWTFLLLIGWVVFLEISRGNDWVAMLWSVGFIVILFACVVLHELGHALTAANYGIGTKQITLLPIGGLASLESMPENPREELLVAIAGPAVNAVIALFLYLFVPVGQFLNQDPAQLEQAMSAIGAGNFLFYLFSANVMLVVFNVIPAFPMDGGRILRALLSMRMSRAQATQIATRLGQLVALFFFLFGLIFNPILALIGVFVFFGAQGENILVQQMALLKNRTVSEAMMTEITVLNPENSLSDVVDLVLSGAEQDFVVADDRRVHGVLYQSDLINAYRSGRGEALVNDVMTSQFETLHPEDPLSEAYLKIRTRKKGFFPVVDNNRLVGAIDQNNINEFMVFRSYPRLAQEEKTPQIRGD